MLKFSLKSKLQRSVDVGSLTPSFRRNAKIKLVFIKLHVYKFYITNFDQILV